MLTFLHSTVYTHACADFYASIYIVVFSDRFLLNLNTVELGVTRNKVQDC